ncbi:MAG: PAS domain-containing protein [Spirochaetaceae bacterium]|jgi:PAS domain S-box-containing protein|nr:PAS domain-containing protein [Spirochaetaceae bacterium]
MKQSKGSFQETESDSQRVLHELQIHQKELEMQNEELRHSKKELLKYKASYAELYDLAPVGYSSISSKGLIFEANLTLAAMLSMERSDLIGQPFSAHILHEDQDVFYHHLQNPSTLKTRQVCELRLKRKDQTPLYVQLESNVILDEWGEADRYNTIIIDITKSKQTEDVLKKSELLLLNTAAIGKVGGWEFDIDTREQTWTQEVFQIHEVDNTFHPTVENGVSFYTDSSRPIIENAVQKAIEHGESFDVELQINTAKNNLRWIKAIGNADLNQRKVFGFFQDITEQKQAEISLKETAWRMEGIIEGNQVGTWEWNVQTGENLINAKWAEMIGYTLDELAPFSIKTWETLTHPDDLKQSEELLNQHFAGDLPYKSHEIRMKHKDGHWVWVLDRGKVITWTEDGKPLMMFGTHTDITEHILIKAEQEKLQKTLYQRSKMEALAQLVGGIAHEFNNILCGIMSATQLLQFPQRNLDEKSMQYTDLILQSSTRAKDLITKLLAFGRKGRVFTTDVNMHKILDETTDILQRTIDKKISISLTKNASNPVLAGDYSEIENAIINLSINAAHAMPDGGEIQIRTGEITLSQSYCDRSSFDIKPGEYIEIEVRDSGTGISPEDLNRIFEPFFTTKEFGTGTGLGLPAVYGAIQDHFGEITVKSEVGVGTSFKILLPCLENSEEIRQEEIHHENGQGLILFVDDEDFNRILGREILESLGYKVLIAENGRESIEVYKKNYSEINLVIMDMIMPEMNGAEAFLKIKEINKNCKVIISSGDTKNEKIDELMTLGLKGFIFKPYRIDELSTLLDDVLSS